MTKAAFPLGLALALGGALAAHADTLVHTDGTKTTGTLEGVTFLADGVPGMYARTAIQSLTIARDGDDLLALAPHTTRKGKLVALRFRTAQRLLTLPRGDVRSVELDPDTLAPAPTANKPSPEPTAPDQPPDELAAQKKALATNLALRNRAWDKAEQLRKDEFTALKARRMHECLEAVRAIASIEDTIETKERKRREAERRWRESERRRKEGDSSSGLRVLGRRSKRPNHNDGLEEDRKKLKQAKQHKLELQRDINRERKQIAERESLRKKRVEALYARQRRELHRGQALTAEQIAAAYEAAITVHKPAPRPPAKTDDNKKPPKKQRKRPRD